MASNIRSWQLLPYKLLGSRYIQPSSYKPWHSVQVKERWMHLLNSTPYPQLPNPKIAGTGEVSLLGLKYTMVKVQEYLDTHQTLPLKDQVNIPLSSVHIFQSTAGCASKIQASHNFSTIYGKLPYTDITSRMGPMKWQWTFKFRSLILWLPLLH